MDTRNPQHDQSLRLKVLIDQTARTLQRKTTEHGASFAPSQRRVLFLLGMYGPLTQQRLLDELELAPASLSEVIGKLEGKGLIMRERLEQDRRIMVVSLTDDGARITQKMLAADRETAQELFSKLDDDERAQLENLLKRINAAF